MSVAKSATVPYSKEAEQRIIGSALIDNDIIEDNPDVEELEASDFYSPSLGAVWQVILDMHFDGQIVDLATLTEKLRQTPWQTGSSLLTAVVPAALITMAADGNPLSAYADARLIKDHAVRRHLIHNLGRIMQQAYDITEPLEKVLAEVDTFSTRVARGDTSGGTSDYQAYEAGMARLEGTAKVKTGFHALDSKTGGLSVGDLTTIAARSSTGKSSLIYQMALEIISNTGKPVGILSPDQEKGEIFSILASRISGVSLSTLDNEPTSADRGMFAEAMAYIRKYIAPKLIINDGPLHYNWVEQRVNKLVRKGCVAVFVDTLQAIDEGRESKKTQIDMTCRLLKGLAREHRIPIVAVSQVKQDVDYRDDKRPRDYDCSDSKNIYDLSHTVMFMYRGEMQDYRGMAPASSEVEVRIAKQKAGPKNVVAKLSFNPSKQTFRNHQGVVPGITLAQHPFRVPSAPIGAK